MTLAYHGSDGDYFAEHADTGSWNAFVDRPTVAELTGDVSGLHLLDAGCGAGHQTLGLVERGATVLGLEGSPTLVEHAHRRLGDRAEIRLHDLDTPLLGLADGSFDGVVCALVIHHLRRREQFLREVVRVLRPGGWFVLSTTHPTSDWRHFEDSYFSSEWVELRMRDGVHAIRYQRMTLEVIMTELLAAGLVLERLVEPRAVATLADRDPVAFASLQEKPSLLALRLRRP